MTKGNIKNRARHVANLRVQLSAEEQKLSAAIWVYLKPHGSMRLLAARLKISPQYLCDIAHGRRKISEAVVEKVMGL